MARTSKQHSKLYQDWPGEKIHNFGIFQRLLQDFSVQDHGAFGFLYKFSDSNAGNRWTLDKPTGTVQREPRDSRWRSGLKLVLVVVDKEKG